MNSRNKYEKILEEQAQFLEAELKRAMQAVATKAPSYTGYPILPNNATADFADKKEVMKAWSEYEKLRRTELYETLSRLEQLKKAQNNVSELAKIQDDLKKLSQQVEKLTETKASNYKYSGFFNESKTTEPVRNIRRRVSR